MCPTKKTKKTQENMSFIDKLFSAAGGRAKSPQIANKQVVILTRVSCSVLLCVLLFHSTIFVEVSWNWVFLQISLATAVTICAMQVTVGIMFANWYVWVTFSTLCYSHHLS